MASAATADERHELMKELFLVAEKIVLFQRKPRLTRGSLLSFAGISSLKTGLERLMSILTAASVDDQVFWYRLSGKRP